MRSAVPKQQNRGGRQSTSNQTTDGGKKETERKDYM
jgi:hypothetical protein